MNVVDKHVQEVLQNLSPLEPLKKHTDIRANRHQGTGSWLLENDSFRSWYCDSTIDAPRHTPTDDYILLCHGMPGAGKTTLRYIKRIS